MPAVFCVCTHPTLSHCVIIFGDPVSKLGCTQLVSVNMVQKSTTTTIETNYKRDWMLQFVHRIILNSFSDIACHVL